MLYLAADLHFGSQYILENFRTQFSDLDEMDRVIIQRFNAKISKKDTIIFVGDVSDYAGYKTLSLLRAMNGKKHLVIGNKDEYASDRLIRSEDVFKTMGDVLNIKDEDTGRWFYACHYPMLSWRNKSQGTLMAYGHTHIGMKPTPENYFSIRDAFDVGIDGHDMGPTSAYELITRSKEKKWDKIDCSFIATLQNEEGEGNK